MAIVDALQRPAHAASDLAVSTGRTTSSRACTEAKGCLTGGEPDLAGPSCPRTDSTGGWEAGGVPRPGRGLGDLPELQDPAWSRPASDSIARPGPRGEIRGRARAQVRVGQLGQRLRIHQRGTPFDPGTSTTPGVAIVASAGDGGYGTQYPASAQYVTSVGGTTLQHASNHPRLGGAGVERHRLRVLVPRGQRRPGRPPAVAPAARTGPRLMCPPTRTRTPPSRCTTPSSTTARSRTGRQPAGAPAWPPSLIASTYALAAHRQPAAPTRGRAPTRRPTPTRTVRPSYAVTSGSNGSCESGPGLPVPRPCGATTAPPGVGTPDGIAGFAPASASAVHRVLNPGPQDVERGAQLNLPAQRPRRRGRPAR